MNDLIERAQSLTLCGGAARPGSFMDDACTFAAAAVAEILALRTRAEAAEREARLLRQQLDGEKEAYALSDKIATERMHKAEKGAAKAYLEGQIDMRKLAADTVMIGCPTSEEEAVKRYGANWRYDAVLALPIKERP